MPIRKTPFVEGEYYHIFNRGVDKRKIFEDKYDLDRFLVSMLDFNSVKPIGSIFENHFRKKQPLGSPASKWREKQEPLVEYVAYCLNPNHFHLLVKQESEKGIERFMQRLGTGYTKYFNEKYKRGGALFQGPFRAVHIESDEQLRYIGAYVNLNNLVHGIPDTKCRTSRGEYEFASKKGVCNTELLLGNTRRSSYISSAKKLVENIREKREDLKTMILEELGSPASK